VQDQTYNLIDIVELGSPQILNTRTKTPLESTKREGEDSSRRKLEGDHDDGQAICKFRDHTATAAFCFLDIDNLEKLKP
jgi:hypothetical protein